MATKAKSTGSRPKTSKKTEKRTSLDELIRQQQDLSDQREELRQKQLEIQREIDKHLAEQAEAAGVQVVVNTEGIESQESVNNG